MILLPRFVIVWTDGGRGLIHARTATAARGLGEQLAPAGVRIATLIPADAPPPRSSAYTGAGRAPARAGLIYAGAGDRAPRAAGARRPAVVVAGLEHGEG